MPQKSRLNLPPLDLGDETIGQRLQRLRKERGFTQVELAEKIGLIQTLVSNYERGRLRLHADMLARFALALGVSADELLGLKKVEKSTKTPPRKLLKRMEKIQGLPRRDQEALLRTIDAFLAKTK